MTRIYLAGPDVFELNASMIGFELVALCHKHGVQGVFPLDEGSLDPVAIYRACIIGVDTCAAVVANISPFRGPHMDPGTAFEIGYAVAKGKPVFAYSTASAQDLHHRIPHELDAGDGMRIDADGLIVEDFGCTENLMICLGAQAIHGSAEEAIAAAAAFLRR